MRRNLGRSVELHSLLLDCVRRKNEDILALIGRGDPTPVLDAIDGRAQVVALANKVQANIERIITDLDGRDEPRTREWLRRTAERIRLCREDDDRILAGLASLRSALKRSIFETHVTRTKIRGYNLADLSK